MDKLPVIVAQVLLRSAGGDRPGFDVPITADNVGRLAPPPQTIEAVAEHFRGAGFTLLGRPGITIGISGSKDLFEGHFGIELKYGSNHTYTVRRARRSGAAASTSGHDPTNIPADNLPPLIGRAVSQIALETAVSLEQPGS